MEVTSLLNIGIIAALLTGVAAGVWSAIRGIHAKREFSDIFEEVAGHLFLAWLVIMLIVTAKCII